MSKRLNLGSGYLPMPGYINIDIFTGHPNFAVDVVYDVRKLKEIYPLASIDEIFAKDVVEHIGWREVPKLLQDWIDILKPGGVLKIRVPDLDRIMDEYWVHRNDIDAKKRFMRMVQLAYGDQTFTENAHLAGFRRDYLIEDMNKMGVKVVKDWYDGGRDLRISAVKDGAEALVTLDHPDYQYIELNYKQMAELFKK